MRFIEVPFSLITVETEYNHPTNNNETSCFGKFCNLRHNMLLLFLANNENLTNLEATRNENDESHQISSTIAHQEEPMDSQHNFNSLSETISSGPNLSQITYIQDKSDIISKPGENNSTPKL